MNDSISIKQAVELLEQDGLLVGYDCPPQLLEHRFSHLSYSSADVTPDTFFICKGATFKEEYLRDAIAKGADEIDMVINIGWVKDGKDQKVLEEINAVKEACQGRILKVIVETCLLTEEEKIRMCDVVSRSEAEYIKTSTGFAGGGATFADVELFAKHVQLGTKIKAAGGIKSVADAEKFLELGAERLGTSSLVAMLDQKD